MKSRYIADSAEPAPREAVCILRAEPNETANAIVRFTQK